MLSRILQVKSMSSATKLCLPEVTIPDEKVVFCYGVAKATSDKTLIFFEDDIQAAASYAGPHNVYHTNELKAVLWKHILSHPALVISPLKSSDEGRAFKQSLLHFSTGIQLTLSEYSDFGAQVFANTKQNLSQDIHNGQALFGSMKGVPALVCGAGPSLSKLKRPVGFTLACGSAMPILKKAGIPFSAGVALDPHPLQKSFKEAAPYDAPLFYQNRLAPEMLHLFTGQKLLIGSRDFASKKLGIDPVDPGWNAGTFGFVLAYLLGCDPITTIGIEGDDKADFAMGLRFIEEFKQAHPERTYQSEIGSWEPVFLPNAPSLEVPPIVQEMEQSLNRCLEYLEVILEKEGKDPLSEVELEGEVGYRDVLAGVWDVWHPLIGIDEIERYLFLRTAVLGILG